MIIRWIVPLIILFGFILGACAPQYEVESEVVPPSIEVEPTPTNPSSNERISTYFGGEFSERKALELLHGNEWKEFAFTSDSEFIENRVEWDLSKASQQIEFPSHSENNDSNIAFTKVLYSANFQQSNQDKYLIITETSLPFDECPFCSSIIGGAIFMREGNKWIVEVQEDTLMEAGGWRNSYNQGEFIQIGEDTYGYLITRHFVGTGFLKDTIVLFTVIDGNFQIALNNIVIAGSIASPCDEPTWPPCYKYDST